MYKAIIIMFVFILSSCSGVTNNEPNKGEKEIELNIEKSPRFGYGINGLTNVKVGKSALYSVYFQSSYFFQIPIGAQAKVRWKVYLKTPNGYNLFYNYKNVGDKLVVTIQEEEFTLLYATLGYFDAQNQWHSVEDSEKSFVINGI